MEEFPDRVDYQSPTLGLSPADRYIQTLQLENQTENVVMIRSRQVSMWYSVFIFKIRQKMQNIPQALSICYRALRSLDEELRPPFSVKVLSV